MVPSAKSNCTAKGKENEVWPDWHKKVLIESASSWLSVLQRLAAAIRDSSSNLGPLVGMSMWKTSAMTLVQPWMK